MRKSEGLKPEGGVPIPAQRTPFPAPPLCFFLAPVPRFRSLFPNFALRMRDESRIVELPQVADERGNLSFIEECGDVPFAIRRVYWIYDVPGGRDRGEHALRETQELIVALSGSFDVVLDDGERVRTYTLNRSYRGVYVPAGTWRRMTNFLTNSLALVLSSTEYDERDYIEDYEEFKRWAAARNISEAE